MFRAKSFFAIPFLVLPLISAELRADGGTWPEESTSTPQSNKNEKGFTGRINREGVRMRLQPTLDSPVVREMTRGELVVVVGESEDFYAVKPPSKTKAFVYRPYVLDGIVEGSHVNVRLDPHLEAPVIGQLNTGDRIEGTISEKNAKWLEIPPPATTVFYIASDFVEKVGDVHYLALHEQRQSEVNNLLNSTYLLSEKELQKPFMDVNATIITQNYEN